MIEFARTTPFRFVRGLATAGEQVPSLYLLVCDGSAMDAVRADLTAEVRVQLGLDVRCLTASEVLPEMLEDSTRPVLLITLDRWTPGLITFLDRNVVLLTRVGAVVLLADRQVAERVLAKAPNLRSRLADILTISPDEVFGGVRP
jgi:hypothetical protein